jgi:hypothetical protein
MKSKLSFTVVGDPQSLKRHRSNKDHTYNPSAMKQQEFIAKCMHHLPEQLYQDDLEIKLIFYFKRPRSHYLRGKSLKPNVSLWGSRVKGY